MALVWSLHHFQACSLGVIAGERNHIACVIAYIPRPGLRDVQRALLHANPSSSGLIDHLAALHPHKPARQQDRHTVDEWREEKDRSETVKNKERKSEREREEKKKK